MTTDPPFSIGDLASAIAIGYLNIMTNIANGTRIVVTEEDHPDRGQLGTITDAGLRGAWVRLDRSTGAEFFLMATQFAPAGFHVEVCAFGTWELAIGPDGASFATREEAQQYAAYFASECGLGAHRVRVVLGAAS